MVEEDTNYTPPVYPVDKPKKTIPTFIGIIIIIVAIIILFGGVFAYQYFAVKTQPIISVTQTQTAGWQTYTNTQYGFSLSYPVDFANVNNLTSTQKNSLMTYMGICPVGNNGGTPRLQSDETSICYIGDQTSDGFAVASLNITVNTTGTLQSCQQITHSPIGELTQQTKINGITFYQDKIEDSGLGHYVTGDSYRIYQNGACYTIDLNIESDRGVLEKGLSADFSNIMRSKLKSILSTFKFTTPVAACVPEGGQYGPPGISAGSCCSGLVEKPTSYSGTGGVCVRPSNQTAGWKTYTNEEYGFELSYSKDLLEPDPLTGEYIITKGVDFNCRLNDCPYLTPLNPTGHPISLYDTTTGPSYAWKMNSITVGGYPACTLSTKDNTGYYKTVGNRNYLFTTRTYVMSEKEKCFYLQFFISYPDCYGLSDTDKGNCQNEAQTTDNKISQMLSTFKFTK